MDETSFVSYDRDSRVCWVCAFNCGQYQRTDPKQMNLVSCVTRYGYIAPGHCCTPSIMNFEFTQQISKFLFFINILFLILGERFLRSPGLKFKVFEKKRTCFGKSYFLCTVTMIWAYQSIFRM